MAPSLGVNLRVTGHCNQGGRKYMEDVFSVAYQQTEDEKDLEYAFFGIFDGHGGAEASKFAKDHLMDMITKQKNFWSDDDDLVLKAIREGFLLTQQAMWKDLPNWRKTASGLPSTAGTTASICFIKRSKLFIGHVGDSGIMLGERDPHHPTRWRAKPLTRDHKPDCEIELARIEKSGGKVVAKSGVPRVVWYRPTGGHIGPVRRSTHIEEIPFLAVARALGDLWSYNAKDDVFVVSPDPDLHVFDIDILKDRCIILGTDGLWNVLSPGMAVQSVFDTEKNNEKQMIDPNGGHAWFNPSKKLVDLSLQRWNMCSLRADNVSVVTVMLDACGPPRAKVLRRLHGIQDSPHPKLQTDQKDRVETPEPNAVVLDKSEPKPQGISIISRFPNSKNSTEKEGTNLVSNPAADAGSNFATRIVHDSSKVTPLRMKVSPKVVHRPPPHKETKSEEPTSSSDVAKKQENKSESNPPSDGIQCSEVTSSDIECDSPDPPPVPSRPHGGHKSMSKIDAAKRDLMVVNRNLAKTSLESTGPMTRTRNQSGQQNKTPPLPVKQVRRSIIPGYSGYNSDIENQPANANTPGNRNLRSSRQNTQSQAAKKPTEKMAVTKSAQLSAVISPPSKKVELAALDKTPENRSCPSQARFLRSRNTPVTNLSVCDAGRSRPSINETPMLLKVSRPLPVTGKKRKRPHSVDPAVPTLAAKMLKMGNAKNWTNVITKKTSK